MEVSKCSSDRELGTCATTLLNRESILVMYAGAKYDRQHKDVTTREGKER